MSESPVAFSIRGSVIVELAVAACIVLFPALLALLPWKGKASCRTACVFLALSAMILALVSLAADAIFGISASWVFTIVVLGMGIGACTAVFLRHRSRFAMIVAILVCAFVLVLHFVDVLPVKPYRRFFAEIKIGMTEPEILDLLQREFPQNGRFDVPVRKSFGADKMTFVLDPTESAWNNECIYLQLSNGRVLSKQYSRD